MGMENEYLSFSRAYTFNKCKKAFQFKYLEKVQPRPETVWLDSWERMQRGTMIHACMEAGFLGKDLATYVKQSVYERGAKYGGFSDAQEEIMPGMFEDSIAVAQAALEWLGVDEWEPYVHDGAPMVESRLELPLPGWKGFLGFADLVARHRPTGSVFVVDYKTRASFERDDVDRFNGQFALYQKALGEIGVPVVGSLLFEIKPTPPKRAPRLARVDSGSVSSVRLSEDGRFRLTPTLRSQEFIDNYWDDFKRQALAIAHMTADEAYRSMNSFNCASCEYERLCQGDLRGDDLTTILARHYTVPRESLRIVEEL